MNPTTADRNTPDTPADHDRSRADRTRWSPGSHLARARRRMRSGEMGPLPGFVGLLVIWVVFQSLDSAFLTPRNLSNLSVDIVGMGLITVGIIFVLLVGDIDLSVSSVSGLSAAVFAVLSVHQGLPDWLAVLLAVLCGTATGALHGFLIARIGVPAFAVTLAGFLGWNGATLAVLGTSGTIHLDHQGLVGRLTTTYFTGPTAYLLATASVVAYALAACRVRRRRLRAGVPETALGEIVVRTTLLGLVAFGAAVALSEFEGLPLALTVFLAFLVGLDLLLRRTVYGRKVHALGGGFEAARRAGINVVWVRASVFAISGTMAAIGGLFLASRISSVGQPSALGALLIDVIAAAVIGGTSLLGGRGRTWSALLGVLVVQSIASGMTLLGIQVAVQYMIIAGVLLAAVVSDSLSRHLLEAHGRI